jgi:hypothetical protein
MSEQVPEGLEGREAHLKLAEVTDDDEVDEMVDIPEMTGEEA